MSGSGTFRLIGRKLAGRFVRQQNGAAAVEFALVAAPFLALLFAIMETALVFFAEQTLETATADSARLIMTGQAQTATPAYTASNFKNAVCSRIYALFNCQGGLYVDVQSFSSFSDVASGSTSPIQNGQFKPPNNYSPGKPGDIVLVRVFYQWPVYVSLLGLNLSNLGNNRLLTATAVFRNEPYES